LTSNGRSVVISVVQTSRLRRCARRDVADDLTKRKREQLYAVAKRWHEARDLYLRRLAGPDDLAMVIYRPRTLRERQRDEGWAPVLMPVHYHQSAFLSAAAQVKTNWLSLLGSVRWRAARRADLSDAQKRWIRTVTKQAALVQQCLSEGEVVIDHRWAADLDQRRETRRLRRLLRRAYSPPGPLRRRNWFVADGRQYKPIARPNGHYRGAWIALTSLTIGSRLYLPLRGAGSAEFEPHQGTREHPEIRIDVGERVVIRVARHVSVPERPRLGAAGLDKGHDTLLTVSLGDPGDSESFGADVGAEISQRTVAAEDALRQRRRLAAYERSIRNTAPAAARRIRRACLGSSKRSSASARTERRFRDLMNNALNAMFRAHPELERLNVESLDFNHSNRGHAFNRRLRRWLKGFLHTRLEYKAELNGVELNVVNAAYTSQTCPRCWFTSSKNRHAQRFKCGSCGFTGSADAVAATNVLRRGSDAAITRFMPSGAVKQILDERWRSALIGSAWGSNGAVPGDDVTRDHTAAGAANNCAQQTIGTGLELPNAAHLNTARPRQPSVRVLGPRR
jgi:IS605 OrfB family transposase